MKLDAVKQTFIVECAELLANMESALLVLEKQPADQDSINAVFRAAHTIKGSSGMFGFTGVVEFTHVLENFLEKLRQGKFTVNSDMIAILLESGDYISELISLYTNSENYALDQKVKASGDLLIENLSKIQPGMVLGHKSEAINVKKEKALENEPGSSAARVANPNWHLSMRFTTDILKHGLDPAAFINYLSETGEIINVVTLADAVPDLDQIDAEECYLGFEIALKSDKSKDVILNVFEFMADNVELSIIEPHADIQEYANLIKSLPESSQRIEQILLDMGSLTNAELQKFHTEPAKVKEKEPIMVLEEEKKSEDDTVLQSDDVFSGKKEAGISEERTSRSVSDTAANFIRIEAKKLDNLINLVGELVINVANIRQLSENNGDKDIIEASLTMSRLVEEVRDSAMNIRMVQIGDTFKRFERVVRDLSRQMGKQIELEISGGETELDKTVVERINDPLMHLIRNSIDHGIGTPEDRKKHGKNPTGTIHINALHETGNIVIEISDDGEGLNKEKILKKAIEKKLAKASATYTDEEIHNFIFEPGLSTSDVVTDVSGRGVGMDVVRRNIESLRGGIEIDSKVGVGTTMRISLPLTLAIIDGFLVEIGSVSYVIPLDMVLECINISSEDEISKESGNFVNLRGEVLPYLRMREFFNVDEYSDDRSQDNIIVVRFGTHKAGLLVDRLIGEYQTVIKPLGKLFTNLHGISGATILGNGTVSLILDIPKLIKHAQEIEHVTVKK